MAIDTNLKSIYLKYRLMEAIMQQAKLFMNGQSQAVRLPKEFRFKGDSVAIKRIGNVVALLPLEKPWDTLLDSLSMFSSDFMDERNQPPVDVREEF